MSKLLSTPADLGESRRSQPSAKSSAFKARLTIGQILGHVQTATSYEVVMRAASFATCWRVRSCGDVCPHEASRTRSLACSCGTLHSSPAGFEHSVANMYFVSIGVGFASGTRAVLAIEGRPVMCWSS